jgi:hypothetical protein
MRTAFGALKEIWLMLHPVEAEAAQRHADHQAAGQGERVDITQQRSKAAA